MNDGKLSDDKLIVDGKLSDDGKLILDNDFTNTIDYLEDELTTEQLYQDLPQMLKAIYRLFKVVQRKTVMPIHLKDPNDVYKEVASMKELNFNFTDAIKESFASSLKNPLSLIRRKLDSLPILLDFIYSYYLRMFHLDFPVYKIPQTLDKFKYHKTILNLNDEKFKDINEKFELLINDEFLNDIRVNMPPYHMRTQLPIATIENTIEEIIPTIKSIIEFITKGKL